jgi:endonuclease/exonuclease/phosphatase family metal-dependent hydrolase
VAAPGELIVTRTTAAITRLGQEARAEIAARPPTREEHARQFVAYPGLHEIEIAAPPAAPSPLEGPARVLFWNAERGKFLDEATRLLRGLNAAAILLCELDLGMARSGQAHTARDLAARLGMGYAFGVEFLELGLGDAFEQTRHAGEINAAGLHGAAILSPWPLERPALIRLEADGNWFDGANGERRVGGRMAMVATLRLGGRPVSLASIHLESHSDPDDRARQLRLLLDALCRYGGDQPALIGGDFNTSTLARDWARGSGAKPLVPAARLFDPVPYEPLFEAAAAAGYDWRACNAQGVPTQRTRPDGTPAPPLGKLDWFLARGLEARDALVIPAVDTAGRAISDHEIVTVTVGLRRPMDGFGRDG